MVKLKKYFLLFVCLLLTSRISAQVEKDLLDKVKLLKDQGVGLIVGYYPYCVGGLLVPFEPDSCRAQEVKYLIWKTATHNYIQRFDDCAQYEPLEDKIPDVVDLITYRKPIMLKEQIKGPEYITRYKGKEQKMLVLRNHSCHVAFSFYDRKTVTKDIDLFFLTPTIDDAEPLKKGAIKHKNINYDHNRKLYLIKLNELIKKRVTQLYPEVKQ